MKGQGRFLSVPCMKYHRYLNLNICRLLFNFSKNSIFRAECLPLRQECLSTNKLTNVLSQIFSKV